MFLTEFSIPTLFLSCVHMWKENDISRRWFLLLSKVFFLSLISYNFGFSVGSQGKKKRELQSLELLNHHGLSHVFSKQVSSLAANPWFSYTSNSRRLLLQISAFLYLKYRTGFLVLLKFSYWYKEKGRGEYLWYLKYGLVWTWITL